MERNAKYSSYGKKPSYGQGGGDRSYNNGAKPQGKRYNPTGYGDEQPSDRYQGGGQKSYPPRNDYGGQKNYNNNGGDGYTKRYDNRDGYQPRDGQDRREGGDRRDGYNPGFKKAPYGQDRGYDRGYGGQQRGSYGGDRGGRGGRGGYGGGESNFTSRPKASTQSQVALQNPESLNLISNQFKLKMKADIPVFMYTIEVQPMAFHDQNLIHQVVRYKRATLERILGPQHVVSGNNIWLFHELEETISLKVDYRGQMLTLIIDKDTLTMSQFNEKSNMLLNVAIKQAFRETPTLKQIGRAPRFFDINNAVRVGDIEIWAGFKASAVQTEMGCTLVIDNVFKFMSTKSCLEKFREIRERATRASYKWEQLALMEFQDKSIIASWGNKRTYIVHDIDFTSNPFTKTFVFNGEEKSVGQYFLEAYQLKISDPKQPLFVVKMAGQEMYLPPEFCLLDGICESMRKGPEIRNAMQRIRIDPADKIKKVKEMCQTLFSQKSLKQWQIEIDADPLKLTSQVMRAPQIWKNNQLIFCNEKELRSLPIQKPKDLLEEKWIFIYHHSDRGSSSYNEANRVVEDFKKSSKILGIKVEDPYFIELDREDNYSLLKHELMLYMRGGKDKTFCHPSMVVVLLQQERRYKDYKETFAQFNMVSQVITMRNARSFNYSKASNILRQINSKAGGDLFNMKFPEVLDNKRTMLIGIDVCHAGPQSIVGFAASTNKEMSQYFSDYLIQRKGQEIVNDKMKDLIKQALGVFAEQNGRQLPTNIIIFRDGVGAEMRDTVLAVEIPQFEEVIAELANQASLKPEVTVIVVNKRITQRFFVEDDRGRLINPPSGCIVDKGLVEHSGEGKENKFDFYLTPSNTTQGCVLPTHFYVPKNDSCLKKVDIQQLTFALCHFYFNWAGPVKVPAPCQYAHKIAEFYMNIGVNKRNYHAPKPASTAEANMARAALEAETPMNRRLHFL